MPTVDQLYPSKFLTKDDVGPGQKYTITSIGQENVGKDDDDPSFKPALHFQEIKKPFIMNKTNATIISSVYGSDTDGWIGKEIVVYFDPTIQFAGKITGGLRVRAPKGTVPDPINDLPF